MVHPRRLFALVLPLVFLLQFFLIPPPPAAHAEHPWPMFRHDLQHSGRSPYTGPAEPTVQWSFRADDGIVSSAAIAEDGTVYVGAGWSFYGVADSNLYALHPDGTLKWAFPAADGLFSSPAIGPDGTIYVGCLDHNLYAVEDSVTYGKLKWKTNLGFIAYSSPAVGADGTIYLGSLNFNLHAVCPDGTYKWGYLTGSCVFSSPAIGPQGGIFFGSKGHSIHCLEDGGDQGIERWSVPTGTFLDGHFVDSSPTLAPDGTVYVGADPYGGDIVEMIPVEDNFWAVSPTGDLKWTLTFEDGVESSPALAEDGTIYVGSFDNHLYAIRDEGNAGTVAWRFPTRGWIDGSPVVDGDGTIYVGSRDSTLYALNPDGALRWAFPAGGAIESSPSIGADGVLYFGTMAGDFYALGSPGPDVGVSDLDLPGLVEAGSNRVLGCTVGNFRSGAESFAVTCTIAEDGDELYRDTVVISGMAGGTTQPVAFAPWDVGSVSGAVLDVTLVAELGGDNNPFNDILTRPVRVVDSVSDVPDGDHPAGIDRVRLHGNVPNPFNAATTISFTLPEPQTVRLKIFDLSGRLVRTLYPGEHLQEGRHERTWDGRDDAGGIVAAGVFFYRLEAGSFVATNRMTMVK